jgi:hypothetical protein
MSTIHPKQKFARGDTWPILVTPHDKDGDAFDLSAGAKIEWALRDATGKIVLSYSLDDETIAVVTEDGIAKAYIEVSPPDSDIPVGPYQDQCRFTSPDGIVSTQVIGLIEVTESFFTP